MGASQRRLHEEQYNVPISRAVDDQRLKDLLAEQGRALGLDKCEQVILLDWERFEPLVRAAVPNPSVRCVLRRVRY